MSTDTRLADLVRWATDLRGAVKWCGERFVANENSRFLTCENSLSSGSSGRQPARRISCRTCARGADLGAYGAGLTRRASPERFPRRIAANHLQQRGWCRARCRRRSALASRQMRWQRFPM